MTTLVKYVTALAASILVLASCNNDKSLQRYLVDKQDDNNFMKVDLATSLLQSENANFTEEEKAVLNSVKKINVVAFPIVEGNEAEYQTEKNAVNEILAQEKYKTLIKFGSGKRGATLKYLGEEEAIDEMIVFASDNERGFAVFRLLGDDMEPAAIVKLMRGLDSGDIDASGLKTIGTIFEMGNDKDEKQMEVENEVDKDINVQKDTIVIEAQDI